jgi:hypothetical protein
MAALSGAGTFSAGPGGSRSATPYSRGRTPSRLDSKTERNQSRGADRRAARCTSRWRSPICSPKPGIVRIPSGRPPLSTCAKAKSRFQGRPGHHRARARTGRDPSSSATAERRRRSVQFRGRSPESLRPSGSPRAVPDGRQTRPAGAHGMLMGDRGAARRVFLVVAVCLLAVPIWLAIRQLGS